MYYLLVFAININNSLLINTFNLHVIYLIVSLVLFFLLLLLTEKSVKIQYINVHKSGLNINLHKNIKNFTNF